MNLNARRREEPEVNLTPVIDVVFLMLIFFMISTTFMREADLQVALPESSEEPTNAPDRPIEITINDRGTVFVGGEALVNGQAVTIHRALTDAVGERTPADVRVVVRADAGAEHQRVVAALDAAGRAGLQQVGIATVSGEE